MNQNTQQDSTVKSNEVYSSAHVVESKEWYKLGYKNAIFVSLILSCILCFSLLFNFIQVFSSPSPKYFAFTNDLRIKNLVPLNKPTITQNGLLNWVSRVVVDTMEIDFLHWKKSLIRVKPDYMEKTFNELITSLKDSGNLDMIIKQKLIVSATIDGTPIITAEGVLSGRKAWKIEIPLTLSYQTSEGIENIQRLTAYLTVCRVPVTEHPKGIKISQIVLGD